MKIFKDYLPVLAISPLIKSYMVLLLLFCGVLYAQEPTKYDLIPVTGETVSIEIPNPYAEPIAEFDNTADILIREFYEGLEILYNNNAISRNIKPEIEAKIIDRDGAPAIRAFYSYSVLDTLTFETDDFNLGEYEIKDSRALNATLTLMAHGIAQHLDKYITPSIEITFNIMGSADAVPISSVIRYEGQWGNPIIEDCNVLGKNQQMRISTQSGIANNENLAFMRSYAVRNYLETRIEALQRSRNTFFHKAVVSPYIGGEHRRVTIEMIIHDVFENVESN